MTFNQQQRQESGNEIESRVNQGAKSTPVTMELLQPEAFQTLHTQYRDRVLSGMLGVTRNKERAEDVTSAAFEKAFAKRASFRGESSFYTWVYAIALNEARKSPRQEVSLDTMGGLVADKLIEPEAAHQSQYRWENDGRLQKALQQLPNIHRRVLVDHFVHGHSVKRIANLARIPVGTVLSRIFTGKRLLRRAWEAVP